MSETTTPPAALTIAGAVSYSGFARSRIYALIGEGRLHPRRAGRRTILLRSELDDVIAALPLAAVRVRQPRDIT